VVRLSGGFGLALLMASPAGAQERADDNAVTQAEDAFGFSVGRESLGIYGPGNTRGFSPTAAGNVRLDGLYFDPAFDLTSTISNSSSIKVGLTAQGYPFTAPSGVVDRALNRPTGKRQLSVVVNGDSFGSYGIELDGTAPITGNLALRLGGTFNHVEFPDGTSNWNHSLGAVARWRPAPGVEITPFWTFSGNVDDDAGPFYIPAGRFLPPLPKQRLFDGPEWAEFRYAAGNHGVVASYAPAKNWVIRAGAFRSVFNSETSYANLLLDLQQDGRANRLVIADPETKNVALSGELRVTRSFTEGPRLHVLHLNLRERDTRRQFDGSDEVDLGSTRLGQPVTTPQPAFTFSPVSRDRVRQRTIGFAYDGRWKDVGQLSLSVARADFSKTTELPTLAPVVGEAQPWLYSAGVAATPLAGVTLYAGYAKGLEESGLAPASAANRNAPLPAIITEQKDAGIRVEVAKGLRAVAGVFDLRRPYFSFDAANRFTQVGDVRSRGIEFSLTGALTPRLNIVAGGVLLDPKVSTETATARDIGEKAVGLANVVITNVNWRTPWIEGLSLDGAMIHRGKMVATTDNRLVIPERARVDIGGRYSFKLAGNTAQLRLQLFNVFDQLGWSAVAPGILVPNSGRQVNGYLAVDI
jgi:iron complex outermembrane recepter protein